MKRLTTIIFAFTSISALYSQPSGYYTDGIRLSENFYGSTARSTAMSGAFGALGGDLGSISLNPAGVGVFRKGEFSFSPSYENLSTSSAYLGSSQSNQDSRFYFGNIGAVYSFNTNDPEGWSNFNLSFGYNKLSDFNSSYVIQGTTNGGTSLTNEFLSYANGTYPENLDSYHERLAFDAYVIDTVPGKGGTTYFSPFQGIPLTQIQTINMTGHGGEAFVAFGANYGNVLYLGGSLNIRSVYYHEDYSLTETDINGLSGFKYYTYDHSISTSAAGFNLKLGAIFKPIDFLRIGVAIHTPTVMQTTQEFNSHLKSVTSDNTIYDTNPTDINGYYIGSYSDNYSVTTPFRAIGSIALISPEIGLISIDYEYLDYRSINFSQGDFPNDIQAANDGRNTYLKSTANLRVGAEARLGSLYIRGGYGYYQSPYTQYSNTSIYSGGLGYRNNNFYFDFAYSMQLSSETYYMYQDPALTAANLKTNTGRFITTLGFKF